MKRLFAAFTMAAAVALLAQPAQAGDRLGRHIVPAAAVGTATEVVTFGSLIRWDWNRYSTSRMWGAYGISAAACAVASPIVGTILENRQLTGREVAVLLGNCALPIVGGVLVDAVYDANPQWEPAPVKVARVKRKKM